MSARWKGPSRDHRAAADSGAEAIRFSTPMTDAPNTRRKAGENERSGASRQKTGGFAGTDSGDPRPRGGPLHRSAAKRFSLWTAQSRSRRRLRRLTDAAYPLRVRPVSLLASQKRNGGCNGPAIIIAESPGRQVAAPTPLRRRAPGGSRFGRSRLPFPPVGLPPRRERRVLRGEGGGDMSANPGCVVPFFAE